MQLGKLLRTAFLTDYFVNEAFRREPRRVLNRGEAVNALKRAIYSGRVEPLQARRSDEMQAVADALSLLANIVMAWNTSRMQTALDRWSNRRRSVPRQNSSGASRRRASKASTCEASFASPWNAMPSCSYRHKQH